MIKDYKLARIDKKNEDWFFKVILSSMIRDDRMTVDGQGLNRKYWLVTRNTKIDDKKSTLER